MADQYPLFYVFAVERVQGVRGKEWFYCKGSVPAEGKLRMSYETRDGRFVHYLNVSFELLKQEDRLALPLDAQASSQPL